MKSFTCPFLLSFPFFVFPLPSSLIFFKGTRIRELSAQLRRMTPVPSRVGAFRKIHSRLTAPCSSSPVIPAKAGIHSFQNVTSYLDPDFRRGDDHANRHFILQNAIGNVDSPDRMGPGVVTSFLLILSQ